MEDPAPTHQARATVEPAPAAGTPPSAAATYRERLWVPVTWWLLGFACGALLCLQVTTTLVLGHLWVGWQALTIAVVAGVLVSWLVTQSRPLVEVRGGELVAGPARLPLEFVGQLRLIDERARRALLGPRANPSAYVFVRAWVRTAVLIEVTDPDDQTPYWLVSTRHPQALAAALRPPER